MVNPYAPPSAAVEDLVVPPLPRPRHITVAMFLLCMGVAIGITVIFIRGREVLVGQILFSTGVAGGLSLAIAARRNWARWVFSVFTGITWLNLIRFLIVLRHPPSNILQAAMIAADVMELVAVILLFTGPSSRWFKQPRSVTG